MPRELVSIITPSFNSATYLPETIESVLGQSYPDWEMLIIDDKSIDHTVDIAKSYASKDSRIRVLPLKEHGGAAVARNAGIQQARGRYIAFLDSDDLFASDKLREQTKFMWEKNLLLTHTYYELISGSGNVCGKVVRPPLKLHYNEMLKSNQIGCLTAIYDSKRLGKVYMPPIQKRQDYGLWLSILRRGVTAYCIPKVFSYYRVHNNSLSRRKIKSLEYNWRLLREFEKMGPWASSYYLSWQVTRALKRSIKEMFGSY